MVLRGVEADAMTVGERSGGEGGGERGQCAERSDTGGIFLLFDAPAI